MILHSLWIGTLPGQGLGRERSLSRFLHPDNKAMTLGDVMSPSQCELLMAGPSLPGDGKGKGQKKAAGPSLEAPNPKGITALPSACRALDPDHTCSKNNGPDE